MKTLIKIIIAFQVLGLVVGGILNIFVPITLEVCIYSQATIFGATILTFLIAPILEWWLNDN